MADAGGGFQLKDLIAVFALVVTVVWNILNRKHTDRVARNILSEKYDQDGWKAEQAEIMRAVRDFENAASDLSILATAGHDVAELILEMAKQNRLLMQKHMALVRELERAAFQPSWAPLAYGTIVDGESDWDRLNSVLADASAMEDPNAMRAELSKVDSHIRAIAAAVNDACRERSLLLHPCQSAE